ncbi:uncharacterized protein MEPE_05922 [Melanopsichium pennsylvanicum]|uniref:Uncharacterized protein n=2 Tax=Melanopsichium pennsylvanicum TaxID=63383 RepID=A0AAJ5C7R6_9BASI|nr:hypothetical protein BN887_03776 [Melanopsichium pennsylvanicum 4]SNX87212.1 uncharacterized protein MEPE_05922 [Melanopsichium pennsylvanicum]
MSDTVSLPFAGPSTRKSRGANPSTDYKSLFLKSKDKYDRVSSDHTELKNNVAKAAAKQLKLREELDYLLDAVASKREQRARIEDAHRERALELEREAAAAVAAAAAARQSLAARDSRDIHNDRRIYDDRVRDRDEYGRVYSERYAEPSFPGYGSTVNRRYASPTSPPKPAAGGSAIGSERDSVRYEDLAPDHRDPNAATAGYKHAGPPSLSPSSHRRHEPSSSPSRYDQRYRESTPPLPALAAVSASNVKRPRPTSVERELLETDEAFGVDSRDRRHHSKRARND